MLTEALRTKISSLPVKGVYLNRMSIFFYDPADKKRILAACARARPQRVVRAVKKHLSLEEGLIPPAWAVERSPLSSTPRDPCRLRKRARILPTRLDLRLALRTLPYRKGRSIHLHGGYKAMPPVLTSEFTREGRSPRSRRGARGRKKSASSAVTFSIVERSKPRDRSAYTKVCRLSVSELFTWIRVQPVS